MQLTRVYVKTELFEGWATIVEYFDQEMLPLQIELDEPGADGHSLKRIAKGDIDHALSRIKQPL